MSKSNRPYSLPPTNVQMSNDYVGLDRGLFLSRNNSNYIKVVEAEWHTYGPNATPGVLRFKLGQFTAAQVAANNFSTFTILKDQKGSEWFEVSTSGPNFRPIMVEYWAKFIYYHYYQDTSFIEAISEDAMDGYKSAGSQLTKAVGNHAGISEVTNVAKYKVAPTKPLELISYVTNAIFTDGRTLTQDQTSDTFDDKFDPVVTLLKTLMDDSNNV